MDLPPDLHFNLLSGLTSTPAPLALVPPTAPAVPLVFASPHSGRAYSAAFVAASRLDSHGLRRSEDSFVDELFAAAPSHGAPLLSATFPRAYCDANREPWELDPTMFAGPLPDWVNTSSPRVSAGLGTIARVVATGEPIYRTKLRFEDAEHRIRACWEPFHATLRQLLDATVAQFGACMLVDCHSMPAAATRNGVDVVLGDAHGAACGFKLVRMIEDALMGMGYRVRRNDPYAGGYITRHYGRPREGVHAVQIEIARSLYMDEARIEKLAAFEHMRADIARLIADLAASVPPVLRRR